MWILVSKKAVFCVADCEKRITETDNNGIVHTDGIGVVLGDFREVVIDGRGTSINKIWVRIGIWAGDRTNNGKESIYIGLNFCGIASIIRDEDGNFVGSRNIEIGKEGFYNGGADDLARPIEVIGCEGTGDLALVRNDIVREIWRKGDIGATSEDSVVWRGRKGVVMSGDYFGKVGFAIGGGRGCI